MSRRSRLGLALLLPFAALGLQWLLWKWIDPFVWFLFFPVMLCGARVGGLEGGLISTATGAALVWIFFMPLVHAGEPTASAFASTLVYLVMGYLLSQGAARLQRAQAATEAALAESRAANERITQLFRKTLEQDERKTRFFADIGQALHTPLTLIMSPLARRLESAELPEAERREDEMILRNAQLLHRHASDLLLAAKIETGFLTCERSPIDLARLVRATASQFDGQAREQHVDYRVVAPPALAANMDREKLQHILLTLIAGAFRCVPPDGGRIDVRLSETAGEAVLEVEDNGPGIRADRQESAFDRFVPLEDDDRRREGGVGLGLAIVREFAVLHGGQARVAQAPGGGALFTVRLPLHAPAGTPVAVPVPERAASPGPGPESFAMPQLAPLPPPAPAHRDVAPTSGAAGQKAPLVLVIEANADMNAFIGEVLRPYCRVASAFDGVEGVERALALRPDLILCDMLLPGQSGDEVVRTLRRDLTVTAVPIVMLTANADDDLRVRLLDAGIQGYLPKPFAVEDLLAHVLWVIDERRRAQGELQRYEQIVATSGDMLLFVDREHRYVVTNPAYARMYGTSPSELRNRPVADVVGKAAYAHIAQTLDRALAGEPQHCTAAVADCQGRQRIMDAEYRPYPPGGDVEGVVISLRDITELKESENALAASEERLRLALTATSDGLWDWDLRTGLAYLAPRYYEIIGYRSGEVVPDFDFFKRLVHPDDLPQVLHTMDDHLRGNTASSDLEYRLITRSGAIKWIKGRGQVVARDADGAPLRVVGTIADISAAKAAEEELRRHTEELAQRNAELERFNRATVGRELDMIALKQRINQLSRELEREPPYALSGIEAYDAPAGQP